MRETGGFVFKSWEAQGRVQGLQGQRATYFAGAWCGYGFHEDGIQAAVAAVKVMGCRIPWELRPTCPKVTLVEGWYQGLFDRFAKAVVKTGYLRLILPNGSELSYGDKDYVHKVKAGQEWRGLPEARATLRVYNMDFFRKIVMRHDTGLGEAYMDKDFEADNLGGFMAVILANAHSTEASRSSLGWLNWVGDRMLYLAHLMRPNTIEGSRRNIGEHYDAGNDMYRLFLDESMMYSCAMHAEGDSLYEAQMRKLDAIIDAAGITAGQRVLEVGCGWGAFAIRAVQRTGCHVTGLTLSKEQLVEAEARVKAAGLQDSISLRFCDYRDCPGAGSFDRVVSIEMIEAVGHANLGTYFRQLSRMLKPGGVCVLQAICCPDERYTAYCRCSDFIREHIFPGGHLPCISACVEAAQGTGLSLHSSTDIGPDYAVTLREWRARWEARKDEVLQLGYSERFWRKYRFYFVYCEAGFDAHYIHTFHMTWVKDQEPIAASAAQPISRQSMSATTMLSASAAALTKELPSDPITQVLLALYFFLAGMLVKGHPHMFLLPLLSCVCVAAGALLHSASLALVPKCSFLSPGLRSWWCTLTWQVQPSHLLYSAAISVASLHYVWAHPEVLSLQHQPADKQHASVVVAASSGFFAFHLWLCVRQRLTTWTLQAIVQYTLLLLMYGVAIYKCVPFLLFLAITLSCELSSVFIPDGYLQHPAGVLPVSARRMAVRMAEQLALVFIRILPHLAFSAMLVASPAAFIGGPAPVGPAGYCASLLGLGYMGWRNWRKAQIYLSREASPGHKDKQAL
ncbi:amino_oxidase domain-containing protein [Haematococcus lacustris]|uniref:Amino_oxidase domain-containing protein n=1 Tax=Haematococcus lacustris TaxID=44745 RepID=A0A699YS10_HAELA|nr:amino_oxidase domain-containing protein [Haematococcus lacustris]